MEQNVQVYNREKDQIEVENIYASGFLDWLYYTKSGKILGQLLCCSPVGALYGQIKSSKKSASEIPEFIKKYSIQENEFLDSKDESGNQRYFSFNDYFKRKFKEGQRPFCTEKNRLAAFAEARYLVSNEFNPDDSIPVKGSNINLEVLLNNKDWADKFAEGPLAIARLAPVDYHRFHFPDDGQLAKQWDVDGKLHSVGKKALLSKPEILQINQRVVSILETENFGTLAYIEVGAFCVGHIVQKSKKEEMFKRGDEKGYFLFGGSTVIILGQKGTFQFDADLVEQSQKGIETLVKLGQPIATRIK